MSVVANARVAVSFVCPGCNSYQNDPREYARWDAYQAAGTFYCSEQCLIRHAKKTGRKVRPSITIWRR